MKLIHINATQDCLYKCGTVCGQNVYLLKESTGHILQLVTPENVLTVSQFRVAFCAGIVKQAQSTH